MLQNTNTSQSLINSFHYSQDLDRRVWARLHREDLNRTTFVDTRHTAPPIIHGENNYDVPPSSLLPSCRQLLMLGTLRCDLQ